VLEIALRVNGRELFGWIEEKNRLEPPDQFLGRSLLDDDYLTVVRVGWSRIERHGDRHRVRQSSPLPLHTGQLAAAKVSGISGSPVSAPGHQCAVWLDRLATVRRSAIDQQTPSARRPATWSCWTRQQLRRNSQVLSRILPCFGVNPTRVKPHFRRSRSGFDSRQLHREDAGQDRKS
jgi:hypothetical protein